MSEASFAIPFDNVCASPNPLVIDEDTYSPIQEEEPNFPISKEDMPTLEEAPILKIPDEALDSTQSTKNQSRDEVSPSMAMVIHSDNNQQIDNVEMGHSESSTSLSEPRQDLPDLRANVTELCQPNALSPVQGDNSINIDFDDTLNGSTNSIEIAGPSFVKTSKFDYTDTIMSKDRGQEIVVRYSSITFRVQPENKPLEVLQLEDYQAGLRAIKRRMEQCENSTGIKKICTTPMVSTKSIELAPVNGEKENPSVTNDNATGIQTAQLNNCQSDSSTTSGTFDSTDSADCAPIQPALTLNPLNHEFPISNPLNLIVPKSSAQSSTQNIKNSTGVTTDSTSTLPSSLSTTSNREYIYVRSHPLYVSEVPHPGLVYRREPSYLNVLAAPAAQSCGHLTNPSIDTINISAPPAHLSSIGFHKSPGFSMDYHDGNRAEYPLHCHGYANRSTHCIYCPYNRHTHDMYGNAARCSCCEHCQRTNSHDSYGNALRNTRHGPWPHSNQAARSPVWERPDPPRSVRSPPLKVTKTQNGMYHVTNGASIEYYTVESPEPYQPPVPIEPSPIIRITLEDDVVQTNTSTSDRSVDSSTSASQSSVDGPLAAFQRFVDSTPSTAQRSVDIALSTSHRSGASTPSTSQRPAHNTPSTYQPPVHNIPLTSQRHVHNTPPTSQHSVANRPLTSRGHVGNHPAPAPSTKKPTSTARDHSVSPSRKSKPIRPSAPAWPPIKPREISNTPSTTGSLSVPPPQKSEPTASITLAWPPNQPYQIPHTPTTMWSNSVPPPQTSQPTTAVTPAWSANQPGEIPNTPNTLGSRSAPPPQRSELTEPSAPAWPPMRPQPGEMSNTPSTNWSYSVPPPQTSQPTTTVTPAWSANQPGEIPNTPNTLGSRSAPPPQRSELTEPSAPARPPMRLQPGEISNTPSTTWNLSVPQPQRSESIAQSTPAWIPIRPREALNTSSTTRSHVVPPPQISVATAQITPGWPADQPREIPNTSNTTGRHSAPPPRRSESTLPSIPAQTTNQHRELPHTPRNTSIPAEVPLSPHEGTIPPVKRSSSSTGYVNCDRIITPVKNLDMQKMLRTLQSQPTNEPDQS